MFSPYFFFINNINDTNHIYSDNANYEPLSPPTLSREIGEKRNYYIIFLRAFHPHPV